MRGGGHMERVPRIRLLTREELALWRHVTADVTPREKKLVCQEELEPSPETSAKSHPPQPKPGNSDQKGGPDPQSKLKAPEPPLNPIVPLDRRLKRKLFSGKAHVDDKIDLHGMTQARAHQALNDFLWRAANSGAKLVLVVTGKGNASNFCDHHAEDRGVLRRQAPHWLRSSALRAIVLSVEEAGRPHGGSGALYVRLRRRASI
jgi:DNA-nicking Smr family endonuclease